MPGHRKLISVFLDRDGVINVNRDDHVKSWDEFVFLPGALEGLGALAVLPVRVIIVTNQSVVGRGIITLAQLNDIHARMVQVIEDHGGRVDRIYVCPHAPCENCVCRKPKPGLLLQAASDCDLDLSRCFMIGDQEGDVEAARAAGCRAILVSTSGEGEATLPVACVVPDLISAAEWLRQHMGSPDVAASGCGAGGRRSPDVGP
jgi:D-glycero-D-manno-heptose 1,7-bisphosphate phosphatase